MCCLHQHQHLQTPKLVRCAMGFAVACARTFALSMLLTRLGAMCRTGVRAARGLQLAQLHAALHTGAAILAARP